MTALFRYDTRYALRTAGGPAMALSVFLLALILLPLVVGPEPDLLVRVGPGLLWLMASIAALLYAPALIQEDRGDGTHIQLLLVPMIPLMIFLSKTATHILLIALPLICLSFLAGPLYGLSLDQTILLAFTLIVGLPGISILSLLGSTLCADARGGTLLLMLLILPLMIPLLVFALSALETATLGLSPRAPLLLLAGTTIAIGVFGTCAGVFFLKQPAI